MSIREVSTHTRIHNDGTREVNKSVRVNQDETNIEKPDSKAKLERTPEADSFQRSSETEQD